MYNEKTVGLRLRLDMSTRTKVSLGRIEYQQSIDTRLIGFQRGHCPFLFYEIDFLEINHRIMELLPLIRRMYNTCFSELLFKCIRNFVFGYMMKGGTKYIL